MAVEGMIIDFDSPDSAGYPVTSASPIQASYPEHFWGIECRGFEVLVGNLKAHVTASHQLGEYVKERASIEKTYVKSLRKLSKTLNTIPDTSLGGFYPVWLVFLRTIDQMCINKDRQVNSLAELSKEIIDYSSNGDDQMKHNMKGEIDNAQRSLSAYRSILTNVKKSHKSYEHCCHELAQLERDAERLSVDPLKEHEFKKAEHKAKKTRTTMEQLKSDHIKDIDTCNEKLTDYEEKMANACVKFQSLDEAHLSSMRKFLGKLSDVHQTCDMTEYKEYKQLSEKMDAFNVEKLISMFAQIKGTGRTKPEPLEFTPIGVDVLKLRRVGSLGEEDTVTMATTDDTTKQKTSKRGLFTSKDKKKRKKKSKTEQNEAQTVKATPTDDKEDSFEVDEEGYRIRPKDADKIAKFSDDESSHGDSSDFDSDSDNEPEKRLKNIKIKLKPDTSDTSTTASVDELSQVVKTLKLDPLPSFGSGVRRSGSSQSLNTSNTPQLTRSNISPDTQSLHDPLDDNNRVQKPPSSLATTSGPNYDITLPPIISPSQDPTPLSIAPLLPVPPSWNLSTSNAGLLTPQSSHNWATFSSDFSSDLTGTENKTNSQHQQQPANKSIDLGLIGGSGFGNETKEDTSKLNKTAPIAPIIVPIPSNPNPTVSVLLPPPGKGLVGPRRRGTGDSASNGRSTSMTSVGGDSLSIKQRPPSTSSLDRHASPVSPLINTQRVIRSNTSSPNINRVNVPANNQGSVVIPFAVAFQEHCHAIFKGSDSSKAVVKVTGQMDFSFPSSCISQLNTQEPLKFRLLNVSMVTKILHNENILKKEDEHTFSFIMDKLQLQLKGLEEKKSSPFCNVQGLKYEVTCTESTFPFHVSAKWKCNQSTTDIKIDYFYNPSVFPTPVKPTLSSGTIMVPIGGGVSQHSLEPLGIWQKEKDLAGWKVGPLIPNTDLVSGSLTGKFTLNTGPSSPKAAIVQFLCDGNTLSGIAMMVLSQSAYKVSLTKNKCLAGKFVAEPQII